MMVGPRHLLSYISDLNLCRREYHLLLDREWSLRSGMRQLDCRLGGSLVRGHLDISLGSRGRHVESSLSNCSGRHLVVGRLGEDRC